MADKNSTCAVGARLGGVLADPGNQPSVDDGVNLSSAEVAALQACAAVLLERSIDHKEASIDARLVMMGLGIDRSEAAYQVMSEAFGARIEPFGDRSVSFSVGDGRNVTLERQSLERQSSGFIYIARCPAIPGLLKIGMTSRHPSKRLKELSSSTTAPAPFELVQCFYVHEDLRGSERAAHADLAAYRSAKTEFFAVDEMTAIHVCARHGVPPYEVFEDFV